MRREYSICGHFGARLADGSKAYEFRLSSLDPYVGLCTEIVLDFTGVTQANSSFINALVAGLVEHHGEAVLDKIVFKGCKPLVRVLVEAAIDLGLSKIEGRIPAYRFV